MTAPSVSLEGKTLWLAQSMPVTPWQVLQAKLRLQWLLSSVPTLFCAVCAGCLVSASPLERALTILLPVCFALFSALLGLTLGLKMCIRDSLQAAEEVLREKVFSAVNARNVAEKLGCSTQPIYLCFENMDQLRQALTRRAVEAHTQRVRSFLQAPQDPDQPYSRYSDYGMGFVQFARQEKQLFLSLIHI